MCVNKLGNDVLIQSASNPGVATVYSHLTSATGNGIPSDTEMSRMPVPRELLNKSFSDTLDYFFGLRRGHCPASIPVGVCRASQIFINPSDEKLGGLQEGDALFVITERRTREKARAAGA